MLGDLDNIRRSIKAITGSFRINVSKYRIHY